MEARSPVQDNEVWSKIKDCLDRVESREPVLRALLPERGRRDRLLREWRETEASKNGLRRRPLAGRLFGVKDVIRADGFATRAGSAVPAHEFDGPSASCVDRLRAAGALVLGKTVTAEFACRDPGATANPHDPSRTPGGSSSGSAAAVAAGYCEAALGTQTIGSIVRPAAYCGVVGYKPSFGRVPGDGVVSYSPSVDCVGLLAVDVEAAIRFARHLVPEWRGKSTPRPRVLVPTGPFLRRIEPEARAAFDRQLTQLSSLGIEVQEAEAWQSYDEVARHATHLTDYEFAEVHRAWFTVYGPFYRPISAAVYMRGLGTTVENYQRARDFQFQLRQAMQSTLDQHGAEAWVSPSAPGPAPEGLESTGDPVCSLPWTFAGLPCVSVPAGRASNGMPLGLQLAGRYQCDEELCTLASSLQGRLTDEDSVDSPMVAV